MPRVSTSISTQVPAGTYSPEFGEIAFRAPRQRFLQLLEKLYPNGLGGRRVLDCACNCGGYTFWAKEAGAGECFGFDVRKHWIDQAKFLLQHRALIHDVDDMRFAVCD